MFFTNSSKNIMRQMTRFNLLYSSSNKLVNQIQVRNTSKTFQLIDDLVNSTTGKSRKFKRTYRDEFHTLKDVYADSGAIAELPKWYRLGILKVFTTIFCFLMIGSMISKVSVKFLEENDIFKPDDDDDDDEDED